MDRICFYLLARLVAAQKLRLHTKAETEYELELGQELAKSQEGCQGFVVNCAIALEEQQQMFSPVHTCLQTLWGHQLRTGQGRKTILTVTV